MQYLNFFDLKGDDQLPRKGFSSGFFEREPSVNPSPQKLSATITVEGQAERRDQRGIRLSDEVVDHYSSRYGLRWMEQFLIDYEKQGNPKDPNRMSE